jgi:nucleoside-diphosphate-sugar epimerase
LNVLITGGTGFIGEYLVKESISRGWRCRLLVRKSSNIQHVEHLENIEFWLGDLLDSASLKGIAENVDYVFHLAAAGHVSAISQEAFNRFVEVNVTGTKNLIEACAQASITKFVQFSSTAAMGLIKKKIVDETDSPNPFTPYQKSKLESEKIAFQTGGESGVPVVVIRPCMVYGVGGRGEFYKMCRLMRKGFFPKVGFGKNLTPLVHVKDVVQGAILSAAKGFPGEVYLIASEHSIELDTMRRLVMDSWGTNSLYPYVPAWLMYSFAWGSEFISKITGRSPIVTRRNIASTVWDREFSIAKARRDLGYKPCVSFADGINETVDWFKGGSM